MESRLEALRHELKDAAHLHEWRQRQRQW
jgi:hypothetical protein